MLRSAREFSGYAIRATDGDVGTASDLYFDDASWKIRYVIVNTGEWLAERKVLVAPEAFGLPQWHDRVIPVNLTREQIERAPDINVDKPVSRRQELSYRAHYGWLPYQITPFGLSTTLGFYPIAPVESERTTVAPKSEGEEEAAARAHEEAADAHLHSVRDVIGHRIEASDGEIGHVEDFIFDDEELTIRDIVVDTRNWLPGKHVLLPREFVDSFDWRKRQVHIDQPKARIEHAPAFDHDGEVTRQYEEQLYSHYGIEPYWQSAQKQRRAS